MTPSLDLTTVFQRVADARLSSEERAQHAPLSSLSEINSGIGARAPIDELLTSIADEAARLLGLDNAGFRLVQDGQLVAVGTVGKAIELARQRSIPLGEGLAGKVVAQRSALVLEFETDPDASPEERAFARALGYSSYLGVPLNVGDRTIGLLRFASRRTVSPRDVDIAQAFAGQAAVAIEHARVYEEAARRAERMRALADLARSLSATLDPDVVGQRIVESLMALLGAGMSAFYQPEPGSHDLLVLAATGPAIGWNAFIPRGAGLASLAVQQRRAYTTANELTDSRITLTDAMRERLESGPYRAMLAVPLLARDTVLGVLIVGDREGRVFDDEEVQLAQMFAAQAALALENAGFLAEATQRRREAEELARLARRLTETLDVEAVGDRIVESVRTLFDAQSSALRLIQPDGSMVGIAWAGVARAHFERGHAMAKGEGLAGRAVTLGRAVWTRDVLEEPDLFMTEEQRRRIELARHRAVLGAPLRVKGTIIGVLTISDGSPRDFSQAEADLLQAVADQAALALQNARFHQAALDSVRNLGALVQVNRAVASTLDHQQVAQAVVGAARQLLPKCACQLWEVAPEADALQLTAEFGFAAPIGQMTRLPFGHGLAGCAAASREATTSADLPEDGRFQRPEWSVVEGFVSGISLPLLHAGTLYGALSLLTRARHDFTSEELRLFESFAAHVAGAMANARLFSREQERARRLTALSELTRLITAADASHDVFNAVAMAAATLLGAKHARLLVDDAAARVLRTEGAYSADPEFSDRVRSYSPVSYGDGVIGAVFASHEAEYLTDVQRDPRWVDQQLAHEADLHACATVPMVIGERIVGVLCAVFGERGPFSPEEKELMTLLADQAAIAIINKRAEEELRAANSETEQLLASISWVLIAVDEHDTIVRWNQAAEAAFGIPSASVVGRPFSASDIPWDWPLILEGIKKCRDQDGRTRFEDVRYRRADDKEGWLGVTVSPIRGEGGSSAGFLLLGRDITERRVLEGQLAQAQKLEAIGQLAAGIAHEINTPIQFVGDNTRFLHTATEDLARLLTTYKTLRDAVANGGDARDLLSSVQRAEEAADIDYLLDEMPKAITQTLDGVQRVATIVRALKEFAHPDRKEKVATDLNQALQSTLTVARNEIKYVADVEIELGELPSVICYASELNQVFLNIIVNAAHAIADVVKDTTERGRIRVETRAEGEDVVVSISDTGRGIPEHVRNKIFDPFFTTKDVGRGTGQGLAIARNVVVDKHGGSLTFESEMGRGTTFFIRLPADGNMSASEVAVS